MNGNETITIKRGHSDDGGFNYAKMTSSELTDHEQFILSQMLQPYGLVNRIGGYEIVHQNAIDVLGETFTVDQLYAYVDELDRQARERHELRERGMVKCDCGHTVHKSQVMRASRGTSCHECYDRMSD